MPENVRHFYHRGVLQPRFKTRLCLELRLHSRHDGFYHRPYHQAPLNDDTLYYLAVLRGRADDRRRLSSRRNVVRPRHDLSYWREPVDGHWHKSDANKSAGAPAVWHRETATRSSKEASRDISSGWFMRGRLASEFLSAAFSARAYPTKNWPRICEYLRSLLGDDVVSRNGYWIIEAWHFLSFFFSFFVRVCAQQCTKVRGMLKVLILLSWGIWFRKFWNLRTSENLSSIVRLAEDYRLIEFSCFFRVF